MKKSSELWASTVSSIIHIFVISLFIAALIKINLSLSAKSLILVAFALFCLLLVRLTYLTNLHLKILSFLRVTFVSVERKRLEPDSKTPAWDILEEDLDIERVREEFEIGSFMAASAIVNVGWAVAVAFVTFLLLGNWESLISLLGH